MSLALLTEEHAVKPYCIRQFDSQGQVVSEREVEAPDYTAALRQLTDVCDGARRIEVCNADGEKAGEMSVDYWRLKRRG